MTKDEAALLGNVLDSLDRLFDNASTVVDVYAVLFATSKALAGSAYSPQVELFVGRLREIVRDRSTEEIRRNAALIATGDLRIFLADELPKPVLRG